MQSTLGLVLLLLAGQVSDANRYGGYQPGDSADPNQGAESADFFSPVTPPERPAATANERPIETNNLRGNTEPVDRAPVQPPSEPPAVERPRAAAEPIKPGVLWEALSSPPVNGRLAGELVTLTDAIRTAESRDQQTEIVSAYWDLSAAVTDYYLSARESTELETLRQGISQPGMVWDEARRALTTRVQTARRTAELAQYRLRDLMQNPAVQGLPLPVDLPHTGAYETRYEANFAGRESSLSRELHELVPSLHRSLTFQTAQVIADERLRKRVSETRSPQSNGSELLKIHELVCLRRREFVRTVEEYNTQIVRYTELASPGRVGTDRLVAMLIEDPAPSTLIKEDADVRAAGAEEPVDNGGNTTRRNRPSTFSEGTSTSREESSPNRPAAPGTPAGEHSIMVKPI